MTAAAPSLPPSRPPNFNGGLPVTKAAVAWWRGRGRLASSPIAGIERQPAPPDQPRALSR